MQKVRSRKLCFFWRGTCSIKANKAFQNEESGGFFGSDSASEQTKPNIWTELPPAERVERVIVNLAFRRLEVTCDEVLQEVSIKIPTGLSPVERSVTAVLEPYARRTAAKKWTVNPRLKQGMTHHDRIVKDLADLGGRMRFNVHADLEGYRKTQFPFPVNDPNRVSRIDVIWYTDFGAVAIYEVENTTGISEAMIRTSNIDDVETVRVLVIPEERISFLKRKTREPMLREHIKRYHWKALNYEDLHTFLNQHKKSDLKFEDMQPLLVNLANLGAQVQQSIWEYFPRPRHT